MGTCLGVWRNVAFGAVAACAQHGRVSALPFSHPRLIFASVLMPMLLAYTVGAGLMSRNRLFQVAVADSLQHSPRPIL